MKPTGRYSLPITLAVLGGLMVTGASVYAQAPNAQTKTDGTDTGATGGYRVGERAGTTTQAVPPAPVPAAKPDTAKPNTDTRFARFEYVSGKVTWRPDESAAWQRANNFQSLRQNGQIWVTEGGRAELRFEDGSLLRLGNDAIVTLETVYRDEQGPFTRIKLVAGLATLIVEHETSVYQVDTPFVTVKSNGPSQVRIGTGDRIEVGVRRGHATVENTQGKETLYSGDFVSLKDARAPFTLRSLPAPDSWDRWNDARDRQLAGGAPVPVYRVPPPVVYPRPSVWFDFEFPFGYGRPYYHGDRDARWGRR